MKVYEGSTGPLADSIIETVKNSNGFALELGVHTGEGSTAMIQEALEDHPSPLHISVDWQDWIVAEHRPKAAWWHLVLGDSRSIATLYKVVGLAEDRSPDRSPGVIFIDTDHNYGQMSSELALWGRIADDSTVWLFHDTWMFGPPNVDMTRAITEYAAANGWTYDDFRTDSHGLGRMRK